MKFQQIIINNQLKFISFSLKTAIFQQEAKMEKTPY